MERAKSLFLYSPNIDGVDGSDLEGHLLENIPDEGAVRLGELLNSGAKVLEINPDTTGKTARYLAQKNLEVTILSAEQSTLMKASAIALEQGLSLQTQQWDISNSTGLLPHFSEKFDAVYFHKNQQISELEMRRLSRALTNSITSNGTILLEGSKDIGKWDEEFLTRLARKNKWHSLEVHDSESQTISLLGRTGESSSYMITTYEGKELAVERCLSCDIVHAERPNTETVWESELIHGHQDIELPFVLLVIAPKACVDSLADLTEEEIYQSARLQKVFHEASEKILESTDMLVFYRQQAKGHLHLAMMPVVDWMWSLKEDFDPMRDYPLVKDYANKHLKTSQHLERVKQTIHVLKEYIALRMQ